MSNASPPLRNIGREAIAAEYEKVKAAKAKAEGEIGELGGKQTKLKLIADKEAAEIQRTMQEAIQAVHSLGGPSTGGRRTKRTRA